MSHFEYNCDRSQIPAINHIHVWPLNFVKFHSSSKLHLPPVSSVDLDVRNLFCYAIPPSLAQRQNNPLAGASCPRAILSLRSAQIEASPLYADADRVRPM